MDLDLAVWERVDGEEENALCNDVETDGEWMWGIGSGMFLRPLMGRRCEQNAEFNLCVAEERQPYRTKYMVSPKQKPRVEWELAVAQGRLGHMFCVDEALGFLNHPQQTAWKIFLRADGIGSWHRQMEFPDENDWRDIVQNEPQSFRWHDEDDRAEEWLKRPALEWFAAFRALTQDENSNVAFAARWTAKERNERYLLSASTQRESMEVFLRILKLAVLTDEVVWQESQIVSCQLQLVDDEPAGERLWVSEYRKGDVKTARFERLAKAAIAYFEPTRGGELANSNPCVQQWLDEYRDSQFHFWMEATTQHEQMEALMELKDMLRERGLDWQNLLA